MKKLGLQVQAACIGWPVWLASHICACMADVGMMYGMMYGVLCDGCMIWYTLYMMHVCIIVLVLYVCRFRWMCFVLHMFRFFVVAGYIHVNVCNTGELLAIRV